MVLDMVENIIFTNIFVMCEWSSKDARQQQILGRRRRSNLMLIVVSVTHFMSWLPLNVANVIITTFGLVL